MLGMVAAADAQAPAVIIASQLIAIPMRAYSMPRRVSGLHFGLQGTTPPYLGLPGYT